MMSRVADRKGGVIQKLRLAIGLGCSGSWLHARASHALRPSAVRWGQYTRKSIESTLKKKKKNWKGKYWVCHLLAVWDEEMCLTLTSHKFLLCTMRAVMRIDETMCKFLAQCLLHCGCLSNVSWIWTWRWHPWLRTWTTGTALRQGLCAFVKFLCYSCCWWLMLEFTEICNKSAIKQ